MFDLLVTSGRGPIEARRFALQLVARLEQLALVRGLEVRDVAVHGDLDAPRSVELSFAGDPALLVGECGTHALIHRSERRGRASRKRWFAGIALRATIPDASPAAIPRRELAITAVRAPGPGGQHVNKTSTAVRVEHLPTGLSVHCAAERSQHANRAHALRRLAALLAERAAAVRGIERTARRNAHHRLERGRPVRTYTLDADGVLHEQP